MQKLEVGLIALLSLTLLGCSSPQSSKADNLSQFEAELVGVFVKKPEGTSDAAALLKDGPAGRAWLATIHGYPNNLAVCQQLIEPYNADPALSVIEGEYRCRYVQEVTRE